MRISNLIPPVIMILIMSACTSEQAPPLEVSKSVQINASLDDVWAYAGDYCAISTWHPVIETCEISEEDGATYRILTLGDGGQIRERHDGDIDNGYWYAITESPLPVKEYSANFQAEGDAESTTITWTATFLADGITDEEAMEFIGGVFEGGLGAISENFSQ